MKTGGSLGQTLQSLQTFFQEVAKETPKTPAAVLQKAKESGFPDPELAAQLLRFLPSRPSGPQNEASSAEISDAFMALLQDADAVKALGAGKTQNPWINIRTALRSSGAQMGASLNAVYQTVRQTGLGYAPTLLTLAGEMRELCQAHGAQGLQAMLQALAAQGLPPWKIALIRLWAKGKKSLLEGPGDDELEDLLSDPTHLQEVQDTDGPWDVYGAQARALKSLRFFGQSLIDLADAVEEKR